MTTARVVLITGSSSGIGEATALKFASIGAQLVIAGSDEVKISHVAHKCRKVSSERILELKTDLSDAREAKELIERTVGEMGRLDVLVTHDGPQHYHLLGDPNLLELMDRAFDANVRSVLQLVQMAVPYLEQSRGSIVNVSSVAALKPIPSLMSYCAAKSALDMITKCLAIELAPKGIRVNSVCPALARTPLLNLGLSEEKAEEVARVARESRERRRFGEIEDIANAIVFLSGEKASFITGASVPIDGQTLVT